MAKPEAMENSRLILPTASMLVVELSRFNCRLPTPLPCVLAWKCRAS